MEAFESVLRKIKALPQEQQEFFSANRSVKFAATVRLAAQATPAAFAECYEDFVVVSQQMCLSAFVRNNTGLFKVLVSRLKHCRDLVIKMMEEDANLYRELVASNEKLVEVRRMVMCLRMYRQRMLVKAKDAAICEWKISGSGASNAHSFLTAAEIRALKAEAAETGQFLAEAPPPKRARVASDVFAAKACETLQDALEMGRLHLNFHETEWENRPANPSLEWFSHALAQLEDTVSNFEGATKAVRAPVSLPDPMLDAFSAVGSIRYPQNAAKVYNFGNDAIGSNESAFGSRRKQLCQAATAVAYINTVEHRRAIECFTDLVGREELILHSAVHMMTFARCVLVGVEAVIGLEAMLYTIISARNSVWFMALLSACHLDDARRTRAQLYVGRAVEAADVEWVELVFRQMAILLAGVHLAESEFSGNVASQAVDMLQAYMWQPGARSIAAHMALNRNVLHPLLVESVTTRTFVLCPADRDRMMALIYAVCPFPWNREESAFFLPIEMLQIVARFLSDTYMGRVFAAGDTYPVCFIGGIAY